MNELPSIAPVKLIIFDCDGVLIDSEILSKKVLLRLLADMNVPATEAYFDAHFLGHSYEHMVKKVREDFGVTINEEFREIYKEALKSTFTKELCVTRGLSSLLPRLQTTSCVATSSSPARAAHSLGVVALNEFFEDRVFTVSEVSRGKPAPDLFLHAANRMGVEPNHCLVVEDSDPGVQAGLSANMKVVRFGGASHTIDNDFADQDPQISTIRRWSELAELFPEIVQPH